MVVVVSLAVMVVIVVAAGATEAAGAAAALAGGLALSSWKRSIMSSISRPFHSSSGGATMEAVLFMVPSLNLLVREVVSISSSISADVDMLDTG